MTNDGGPLQIVTPKHYHKRTMWDMYGPPGTILFAPRYLYKERSSPREWDRSEGPLPSPWVCFDAPNIYKTLRETMTALSVELERNFRTPPLSPAMFRCMPDCPWLNSVWDRPVVFSSAEGNYYLKDDECALWKFEGMYSSSEDFIHNADWNTMEWVESEDDRTIPNDSDSESDEVERT
ncbi:hypothetical protein B0H16DRAFT_1881586 [Mycena metata]|uniref:Uncharacterized protein n=1 Tax=Mycena metata TaxID=1033252 RepID=A0AAD7JSB7_9AGAR|nr:hypothetical protein B0H16DRAFT_1881586 [Mycena metata]